MVLLFPPVLDPTWSYYTGCIYGTVVFAKAVYLERLNVAVFADTDFTAKRKERQREKVLSYPEWLYEFQSCSCETEGSVFASERQMLEGLCLIYYI